MTLTKIVWTAGTLALLGAITAVLLLPRLNIQVWSAEPRPANVPEDAIAIPYIAKSRLWAKCRPEGMETRCRIFNSAGSLLQDDVFVSYGRSTSVGASDVEIVPERSGVDYLWLKNGEILLPKTNYAEHRRNVEKIIQKTQN